MYGRSGEEKQIALVVCQYLGSVISAVQFVPCFRFVRCRDQYTEQFYLFLFLSVFIDPLYRIYRDGEGIPYDKYEPIQDPYGHWNTVPSLADLIQCL